jgi:transposase
LRDAIRARRWVSRFLESLRMKVLVANSRKMRSIYENERKSDGRDAEQLARIAREDPKLSHPIEQGSQEDCGWNKYGCSRMLLAI